MCFRLDMLGSRVEWSEEGGGRVGSEQWAAAAEEVCVSEVEVITMTTSPSLHFTSAATRPLPDQVSAGFLPLHVSVRRDFWTFSLQAGVYLSERSRRGAALTVERCVHANGTNINHSNKKKKKERNKQAHLPRCGHTSHPPYSPSPSPLERADPLFKRTKWSECLTTPRGTM